MISSEENLGDIKAKNRTQTGIVVSDKMQKTIVVRVDRRVRHPLYGKYLTKSSKLHAHDENNEASIGDVVTVVQTRPKSKTKYWALLHIDERNSQV